MDFLQHNWYLILTAVVSGGLLAWPKLTGSAAGLSAQDVVIKMNREKAWVIDIRPADQAQAGTITGARLFPNAEWGTGKGLPSNKKIPLIVVCEKGVQAAKAEKSLRDMGHENVALLAGGMQAWASAGLPTVRV